MGSQVCMQGTEALGKPNDALQGLFLAQDTGVGDGYIIHGYNFSPYTYRPRRVLITSSKPRRLISNMGTKRAISPAVVFAQRGFGSGLIQTKRRACCASFCRNIVVCLIRP